MADALISNKALKTDNVRLTGELAKARLADEQAAGVIDKLQKQLAGQKGQISDLRQDLAIAVL